MSFHPAPDPAHGTPDLYRVSIAECVGSLAIYGETVTRYAELGDDAGLAYGLRCMAANLRCALNLLGDLEHMTERQQQRGPNHEEA